MFVPKADARSAGLRSVKPPAWYRLKQPPSPPISHWLPLNPIAYAVLVEAKYPAEPARFVKLLPLYRFSRPPAPAISQKLSVPPPYLTA